MKCNEIRDYMSLELDNELSKEEQKKLEEHLASCEACTVLFEEYKAIQSAMKESEMLELPKGFEEELHFRLMTVKQEEHQSQKPRLWDKIKSVVFNKNYLAGVSSVLAIGLIAFISTGNLSDKGVNFESADMMSEPKAAYVESPMASENASDEAGVEGQMGKMSVESVASAPPVADALVAPESTRASVPEPNTFGFREERLIIRNATLRMKIENYDQVKAEMIQAVEAVGGYVEQSNTMINNRVNNKDYKYGTFVLRVPAQNHVEVLNVIKSYGQVQEEYESADDITKQYRDTASEVENLTITETRLQELLKNATQVKDLLEIENELTRIRNQINAYSQQLKSWEQLVDMTSVSVDLEEVESLTPKIEPVDDSLMGKAYEGLVNTINAIKGVFERFVIAAVAFVPVWLPLSILFAFVYRHFRKKQ